MVKIKSTTGIIAEISELGAQLSRLADNEREYIYDNTEVWPKHSPVLFPFVGRLPNQQYQLNGKTYDMLMHGFAPSSDFEVVSQSESAVTLHLIVTDKIKAMYPFDFGFYATYELNGNTLEETFKVVNNGNTDMYYGFGSHPGFNVPIDSNLKFEDYYVEFPESSNVKHRLFDDSRLDTGTEVPFDKLENKKLHLQHNLFDNDAILLTNTGFKAIIKTDKDSKRIVVEYPDTPFCAVWHKVKEQVPFVCIEPWICVPGHAGENDISKKPDFNTLKPGQSKEHKLLITIEC
ncbi:MAG: aldose 1-epimerase family protein [Sphaerochaetaceae bacterium]|nr:aldose 1-epimerase family protein [Sphaerochaetaceae bacterium]